MKFGAPFGYAYGTIDEYRDAVSDREYIVDGLVEAYRFDQSNQNEPEPSDELVNSWRFSLLPLLRAFDDADLSGDQIIILEAILKSRKRIDALICGRNEDNYDVAVLGELKGWFWARRGEWWNIKYHLSKSDQQGVIDVAFETRDETSTEEKQQPILQLDGYKQELVSEKRLLISDQQLSCAGFVYFPHCCWLTEEWNRILTSDITAVQHEYIPIYTKSENPSRLLSQPRRDRDQLASRLSHHLCGTGVSTFEKIKLLLNDIPLEGDGAITQKIEIASAESEIPAQIISTNDTVVNDQPIEIQKTEFQKESPFIALLRKFWIWP